MDKTIIGDVANNLRKDVDEVEDIVNEFVLQLRKHFYEFERIGYTGFFKGELYHTIPKQAYYHLVCFIGEVGEKYEIDEVFIPSELADGGFSREWLPYYHQSEGWTKPEE